MTRHRYRRIAIAIVTLLAAVKVSSIVLAHHQHWSAWLLVGVIWWLWWKSLGE